MPSLLAPGLLALVWACDDSETPAPPPPPLLTSAERALVASLSPLPPPPADPTNAVADDPQAASLGQRLFFDPRLSATGEMSCATCHDPERGFADGLALPDIAPEGGRRHTPTLLNAAHHRWQFWDGRADSLWAQAARPLENPAEQDVSRTEVAHLLATDPDLREAYEGLFGPLPDLTDAARFPPAARPAFSPGDADPRVAAWQEMDPLDRDAITRVFVNLCKCIAAFERRIVRADAPFDAFAADLAAGVPEQLAGVSAGFGDAERRGLKLFAGRAKCIFCHLGPNFSNSEFHNLGLPTAPGGIPADPGRAQGLILVASDEFNGLSVHSDDPSPAVALKLNHLALTAEQLGQFKTPSLRNLRSTAPYMHGGQFSTLEQVVDFYNRLPGGPPLGHREETLVPLELDAQEQADLVSFLESLEGAPLPAELTSSPAPLR